MFGSMMTCENIQLFWQQLKHNGNIYQDALVYRQLQILNTLSNSLQQSVVGLLIFIVTLALSMNLSLLIGLISETEEDTSIIMWALFGAIAVDSAAVLLVLLGGMVAVHKTSRDKLQDAKNLTISSRWSNKYWRSCSLLKAKFGDNNFLEKLTPLRCFDMGIQLSVQFLLLSRST